MSLTITLETWEQQPDGLLPDNGNDQHFHSRRMRGKDTDVWCFNDCSRQPVCVPASERMAFGRRETRQCADRRGILVSSQGASTSHAVRRCAHKQIKQQQQLTYIKAVCVSLEHGGIWVVSHGIPPAVAAPQHQPVATNCILICSPHSPSLTSAMGGYSRVATSLAERKLHSRLGESVGSVAR